MNIRLGLSLTRPRLQEAWLKRLPLDHSPAEDLAIRMATTRGPQEAWPKPLPFQSLPLLGNPAAATGVPPAKDPPSRIATTPGPPPPADSDPPAARAARPSPSCRLQDCPSLARFKALPSPSPPAPPAPLEAWERVCRPRPASDGAFTLQALPVPVAPAAGGCSSEQGLAPAGPAWAPSPGPPPQQAAAGRRHDRDLPAPADGGASGWVFWADWVTEGCSGDGGGCGWSGGGGGVDRWGGPDDQGGGGGGGWQGGDGDSSGSGGGEDWDLGAWPTGEAWVWGLPRDGPSWREMDMLGDAGLGPFSPAAEAL